MVPFPATASYFLKYGSHQLENSVGGVRGHAWLLGSKQPSVALSLHNFRKPSSLGFALNKIENQNITLGA